MKSPVTQCTLSKFSDDPTLWGVAVPPEGCADLQQGLRRLQIWVEGTPMRLNKDKCRVLHLVRNNPKHQHRSGGDLLESSSAEKTRESLRMTNLLNMKIILFHT